VVENEKDEGAIGAVVETLIEGQTYTLLQCTNYV